MTEKDPRIAKIVEGKQRGETYTKIAEDMGVSRKTLYNLRGTAAYLQVCNELFVSLMDQIDKFSESESTYNQIDSMKERGKMLRALLPSLSVIQHKKAIPDPDSEV